MAKITYPPFKELNTIPPDQKTPIEKLYMTALVMLTGHPNCVGKDEEKVHDWLVKWAPLLDF